MANLSKSLAAYTDVNQVLLAAMEQGELALEFPNVSQAVTFVARCNRYRVMLRQESALRGGPHASPYDILVISRKNADSRVTIKPRGTNFTIIRVADGGEVSIDPVAPIIIPSVDVLPPSPPEPSVAPAPKSEDDFLDDIDREIRERAAKRGVKNGD